MSKSPLTPEQWVEARRLRSEGATFAAIAAGLGISASTITNRARNEGWPPPAGSVPRARPQARPSFLPADTADVRRGLMHRLYALLGLSLEMTELRMSKQLKEAKKQARSKDGEIPAAGEDELRQIANTMKTLEQATELDPELDRAADGGARTAGAETRTSETDAFRREIAERLEKLIPPA